MGKIWEILASRKAWATLAVIVATVLAVRSGALDAGKAIETIGTAVAAWVVGQGLVDSRRLRDYDVETDQ